MKARSTVWSLAFAALCLAACAGPSRLPNRWMGLTQAPTSPFSPEGRYIRDPSPLGGGYANGTAAEERTNEEGRGQRGDDLGNDIVETARALVGKSRVVQNGRTYPNDCTGLVRAVFDRHGVRVSNPGDAQTGDNGVTAMYRYIDRTGDVRKRNPRPGDLVFFKNTYDRNRDGRTNDGLTHVGIVEGTVGNDGTVLVIHRTSKGVVRHRMNLKHPGDSRNAATGEVLNDVLRGGAKARLTGELFVYYGTPAPLR